MTRLRHALQDGQLAGRWGGEEFLVVLPSTTLADALAFAERVRAMVDDEPFALAPGIRVGVTVSGGCAVTASDDSEELVRWADAALYRAKESGRNCVAAAEGAQT